MIDYVLVTVIYKNKMKKDMEIPANIEISKVAEMLLDSLQTAEPLLFGDLDNIHIGFNGNIVNSGTFLENRIWDGSIIEII